MRWSKMLEDRRCFRQFNFVLGSPWIGLNSFSIVGGKPILKKVYLL